MSLHFPNSWLEILIVAGDPERLRPYRDALRMERGNVHAARDGAEVRALLRGESELEEPIHPNVVLVDLSVPRPDWPAIAGAIVDAALTGPIIAMEWFEGAASAAGGEEVPEQPGARRGDLSRLIRRAIVQKRSEDERAARLRIERELEPSASAVERGEVLESGGIDGPGSHAGIGESWLHLTLRESTGSGILSGLASLRELSDRLRRMETGDLRVTAAVTVGVRPNELISKVVERYRPVAEARGVRLLEIEDEYAPPISADEAGLLAALGVLTAYTLHFARHGQEIRISTGVGDGEAVDFGVSLHEAGIAEDHLPLLADAFGGAASIVEAHGARLAFGSSWGRSCGFSFRLPASLSDPSAV